MRPGNAPRQTTHPHRQRHCREQQSAGKTNSSVPKDKGVVVEWSGARWWSLVSGEWAGGCGCVWVCVRVVVVVCWVDGRVGMNVGMCVEKGKRTKREDVSEWVVVGGGSEVVLGCCWWWWWIGGVGLVGDFILCGSEALITRLALIAVFCTGKLCS